MQDWPLCVFIRSAYFHFVNYYANNQTPTCNVRLARLIMHIYRAVLQLISPAGAIFFISKHNSYTDAQLVYIAL